MTAMLRTPLIVLALAMAPAAGHAEEWQFTVTPYFWAVSIKGDLGTLPGLPPAHVDVGFSDVVDTLQMGFASFAEARNGRWGVLSDFNYVDIGASKHTTIRDTSFLAAGVGSKTITATLLGAYRVHETESLAVDVYGGARITSADTDLKLTLPSGSVLDASHKETWVDPVVGGRVIATLSPKWSLTGVGDIGGFGVSSDFAWQLMGTVNYRINDQFSVSAGYRYYDDDYEDDGFVFDAAQHGPIIGTSIRF